MSENENKTELLGGTQRKHARDDVRKLSLLYRDFGPICFINQVCFFVSTNSAQPNFAI